MPQPLKQTEALRRQAATNARLAGRRPVKVTICTADGEVLDQFQVMEWRACDVDDEGVGSMASESLLVHRIKRAMDWGQK